jgi:ABC-type antimicrobial peptide transport system permease subunit
MDIILFSILILFTTIILVLGFIKNHIILTMFAGISFIFLGILSLNGLSYVSSTTMNATGTNYLIVDHYASWTETFGSTDFQVSWAVGFLFALFGLFLLLVSGLMVFNDSHKPDFSSDED